MIVIFVFISLFLTFVLFFLPSIFASVPVAALWQLWLHQWASFNRMHHWLLKRHAGLCLVLHQKSSPWDKFQLVLWRFLKVSYNFFILSVLPMCLGTVPYLLYQDVTQAHCSSSLQLEIWCLDISGKNDSVIFVVVVVVDLDRIWTDHRKKICFKKYFFWTVDWI